ncbi:sugar MFS transporter [Clostridium sp. DJ247]|uniref:MFS transporter n=1 Tax=Clostridium sp. DJ247 TaxID=2726188 RepID=UPI001628CB94|nr:MFS transporter [Clostridium sp. DJ247]MBC2581191.1 MFS transporter [Clostridium sp. DJ247]
MEQIQNKNSMNIPAISFVFLIMILMAVTDNMKGAFVPTYKKIFSVDDVTIGFMITLASIGYITFTYIGGFLCEKIGQKKVMILGIIFIIVGLIVLSKASTFTIIIIGTIFNSSGVSLIGIGANTIAPVLFISYQAVLMNLTHFCYGLGSAAGQRFVGLMIGNGMDWQNIFLIVAVATAVVLILFLFIKVPSVHEETKNKKINTKEIFSNKLIYFYIIALGFYIGAEWSTGNWFINYTSKVFNFQENMSSYYAAFFFTTFAIGRFVGGFIVEKLGYLNSVKVSLLVAVVIYIFGIILGIGGVMLISLSGLFFAITFPTIILTINKVFKENTSYITGTIITFASVLSTLINLFIGYLNNYIGIKNAFYTVPVCLLVSLIFVTIIHKNINDKCSSNITVEDAQSA